MAISNRSIIYVGNTSNFDVIGLTDAAGSYVNNATVRITSLTPVGETTNLTGVTLPLTCVYRAGTNGNYRGTLPNTMNTANGEVYEATVQVTANTGEVGQWKERIRAKIRRA